MTLTPRMIPTPANPPTMSRDELAAATRTLTRVLGCPRLQGAYLDRQVAAGNSGLTRARLLGQVRRFLRAVDAELKSRAATV